MDFALLTVPEVAELCEVRLRDVHSALRDRSLAVVVGEDKVKRIPRIFLDETVTPPVPHKGLRGTLMLLLDGGMSDEEAVTWLLAEDETLRAAPAQALAAGRIHEVRRVAAALAF
ncbi:MAG: Rv2175c family DNA-binding protein [Buchananella hordeovulneris]|nr:Rv2175c family DNA-binding protein [Buchananella hordeovulneris]